MTTPKSPEAMARQNDFLKLGNARLRSDVSTFGTERARSRHRSRHIMARQAIDTRADNQPEPEAVARAAPTLTLVEPPPAGAKALQLFKDARAVSLDHLSEVVTAIVTLRDMLESVVESGALYGPGVHEFAERLSEDLLWKSKSLELLSLRQRDFNRQAQRRR